MCKNPRYSNTLAASYPFRFRAKRVVVHDKPSMADAAEEPPAAEEPAPQADPEAAEEPAEEPTESEAAAAVLQSAAPKSPRMLAQQSSNLGEKGAALNSTVQLNPEDGDVQEQLRQILIDNAVRVIDLFRDWDDDGNGKVDKKEFRKAMKLSLIHI